LEEEVEFSKKLRREGEKRKGNRPLALGVF
jgi:hypothetical protein